VRVPGGLGVEIHFRIPLLDSDAWDGARPFPVAGLLLLSPTLHLWHLLVHGCVHHPERSAALRELELLEMAVRACGPPELEEVARRVDAHPRAARLRALLEMGRALAARSVPADAFRPAAALAGPVTASA